ncbi:MAG: ornithine carbamoyltransferase [Candidatus Micrarchaeota archaeon]
MVRHLVGMGDLTPFEISKIIDLAIELKAHPEKYYSKLDHKSLVMLFEKSSTRTRLSFEIGMTQLGGHAVNFTGSQLSAGKEDVADTARTISAYADILMARVFKHETVAGLAKFSKIPVINALSDLEHPCQALADIQTIKELKGWKDAKVAYVGDGNNVCNSLMLACAMVGVDFAAGTPKNYMPNGELMKKAEKYAEKSKAKLTFTNSAVEAVRDADVVYTDVWISMGEEHLKEQKMKEFGGFQVNGKLMALARKDAIFMHCLPAKKGYEVTKEVIEGKQSVVFQQAENRMHAQKALMLFLLGKV